MNWIAGWNKRIKLTISGSCIEGDLSNFPIMVHLDSTCSGVFNELGSNSKRISVVTSDQRQCNVEVESWDESTKNAWLWVKIPTLSSGVSSDVYLYYDNLRPDNSSYVGTVGETPAQNVWDSNFASVWHMSQDPNGDPANAIKDSTSNNNHGTPVGSMTSSDLVDGKIGKALEFDGSNDEIRASAFVLNDGFTFEMLLSDVTKNRQMGENNGFQLWSHDGSGVAGYINTTSTTEYFGGSSTDTGWKNIAVTNVNGSKDIITYSKGVLLNTTTLVGNVNMSSASIFCIGNRYQSGGFSSDGVIDEVRISNIHRSVSWIKVTNYSNNDELINYGNEETVSSGILPGWNNRLKLTIQNDHIDNTLTDFPVMIKLSEDSGFNSYDNRSVFYELETNINRKKIAITDSTGVAQCFVEIERFSCAETEAVLWTKLPVIYADVGTHFYLYYDKSQADNNLFVGDVNSIIAQNVWDDSFVGVWHMNQDPTGGSGCIKDSTLNINHGTPGGTMTAGDLVDGKIGKALDFDGDDDYINVGSASLLDNIDQRTLEAIIKFDTFGETGGGRLFYKNQFQLYLNQTDTRLQFYQKFDTTHGIWVTPNSSISTGTYYNLGVAYDRSSITNDAKIFLNGISQGITETSIPAGDVTSDAAESLYFGNRSAPDRTFDGILDEFRISNILRSDAWIKATHYSNWDSLIVFEKESITASWLDDWAHRIKLTIDHTKIDSSLIDFPVLVTLTSGVQDDFFSEMSSSDSKKIAVTKNDGLTQCPVEIEQFDTASGIVNLWTKILTIVFDNDTVFYLYYDKNKDDNDSYVGDIGSTPARNVWDENFVGVWHMNQDPSGGAGCIKDSTSNSNHGTPGGSMTSGDLVDGKIGKALDFDGGDDYIGTTDLVLTTAATILLCFKPNVTFDSGASVDAFLLSKWTNAVASYYLKLESDNGKMLAAFRTTTANNDVFSTTTSWSNFNQITSSYDNGVSKIYTNGSLENTTNGTAGSLTDGAGTLKIGTLADDTPRLYFGGVIDEVRISNIARSASWIKATYYSNWNTLLTQGSVQTYTPPPDYYYHGYVKEKGAYVTRKVYLYKRNTGALIDSCMSNASTGYYLLETSVSGEHFVVALDDDAGDTYNALIEDRLYPNDM